jgi:hypothetical protein
MSLPESQNPNWRAYLSPLKLTLLAINAVCFGACLVLLVSGADSISVVFLTIGTGLSFLTGLVGAIVASRKQLVADTR